MHGIPSQRTCVWVQGGGSGGPLPRGHIGLESYQLSGSRRISVRRWNRIPSPARIW